MTCDIQDRRLAMFLELLIEQGLDGTAEAISILLNEAMRLERERPPRSRPLGTLRRTPRARQRI